MSLESLKEMIVEYVADECNPKELYTATDVVSSFGSDLLDEFHHSDIIAYLVEHVDHQHILEYCDNDEIKKYIGNEGWEKVGDVDSSSSTMLVGDASYFLGDDAPYKIKDWEKFVDMLEANGLFNNHIVKLDGEEGSAFAIYARGETFPVFVKRENGRIKELKVVFQ